MAANDSTAGPVRAPSLLEEYRCPFCRVLLRKALGWLHSFRGPDAVPLPTAEETAREFKSPATFSWVRCHVLLARAMRADGQGGLRPMAAGFSFNRGEFTGIAEKVVAQVEAECIRLGRAAAKLPRGQVLDLAHELASSPQAAPSPYGHTQEFSVSADGSGTTTVFQWKRWDGGWRCLDLRRVELDGHSEKRVQVKVLQYLKSTDPAAADSTGLVYRLDLELMPDGCGEIYHAAPLGFTELDHKVEQEISFRAAIANARQAALTLLNLSELPANHDIRWSLTPLDTPQTQEVKARLVANHEAAMNWCGHLLHHDGHPLTVPPSLRGDSAGLAFAIGMVALLGPEVGDLRYSTLDLSGVAITGAVDPSGGAREVGGVDLTGKLGGALQFLAAPNLRLVRELVYPAGHQGVPDKWHAKEALIHAEGVDNLATALDWLREQTGSRRVVREAQARRCGHLNFLCGGAPVPMEAGFRQLPAARKLSAAEIQELRRRHEEEARKARDADGQGATSPVRNHQSVSEFDPHPIAFDDLFSPQVLLHGPPGSQLVVLLAEPGGGKTTTSRWSVWRAMQEDAPSALRGRLPVWVRLAEWARHDPELNSLEDFLALPPPDVPKQAWPKAEVWRLWLERGDLFLVLDGLDELPPSSVKRLGECVTGWGSHMPVLLTCRTHNFNICGSLFFHVPIVRLGGLEGEQVEQFIHAYPYANWPEERRAELVRHVQQEWQLVGLAAVPFFLDALCLVAAERAAPLATTRAELLDQVVDALLDPARPDLTGREAAFPAGIPSPTRAELRGILARIAWTMQWQAPGANRFSLDEFEEALKQACQAELLEQHVSRGSIKRFLTDHARLVTLGSRASCFAHNQILEFLAADHLARLIESGAGGLGWQQPLLEGKQETARTFVLQKPFEAQWTNVLSFLPNRLRDPLPFFRLLAPAEWGAPSHPKRATDLFRTWARKAISKPPAECHPEGPPPERTDDLCRHRLTQAVRGMGELTQAQIETHGDHLRNFAANAFGCFWESLREHTVGLVSGLQLALPGLARVEFTVEGKVWSIHLIEKIRLDSFDSFRAADALASLGPAAALRSGVLDCLYHSEESVRNVACYGLGKLASAGFQRPELAGRLVELLRHSETGMQRTGCQALAELGSGVLKHPGVVIGLIDLLSHSERSVHREAALTLSRLSPEISQGREPVDVLGHVRRWEIAECVVQHPELVDELVDLLSHSEEVVSIVAAVILERSSSAFAQRPGVVRRLVELLFHSEPFVQWAAILTLGGLSANIAQHPDVVDSLVGLLNHSEASVQIAAAKTFSRLGPCVVKHPGVVSGLVGLLNHSDWLVQSAAAETLGAIGSTVTQNPEVLDRLVELSTHPQWQVREGVSKAFSELAAAAKQNPDVVGGLVALLGHSVAFVQRAAASTLGKLGSGFAEHPGVVGGLVGLLSHSEAQSAAASALGELGSGVTEHSGVVRGLVGLLNHSEAFVQRAAATALGKLGSAVAKDPRVLSGLIGLLSHSELRVQTDAAISLCALGSTVVQRPDVSDKLLEAIDRSLSSSSKFAAVDNELILGLSILGPAVARSRSIIDRLVGILEDGQHRTSESAVKVLGELGSAVTQHAAALNRLVRMISFQGQSKQSRAIEVISLWGRGGVYVWRNGTKLNAGAQLPL